VHALVIRFDRFSTAYLGCYGNTWIETPHLDAFASSGIVFDQCFAEDLTTAVAEAMGESRQVAPPPNAVLSELARAGVHVTLCTQRGSAIDRTAESLNIDRSADARQMAAKVTELWSHVCRQAQGVLWLDVPLIDEPWRADPDDFLTAWDHVSDGMLLEEALAKVAPDRATANVGDGVPGVLQDIGLCSRRPQADSDAAARLRRAVYAACAHAADRWFGQVWESVRATQIEPGLVIVTADAGDLVGRHAMVDAGCPPLVTELVQVPLLLHVAGIEGGTRHHALVASSDVDATLLDDFGIDSTAGDFAAAATTLRPILSGDASAIRNAVHYDAGPCGRGLRTPEYSCLTGPNMDPEHARLFIKPDDVWDVFDVAGQHEQLLQNALQRIRAHRRATPADG